ncbi:sensor histidine kinase [Catenovulum maritimum]|uniref:histidine kinase n=1 Tax=Catenovulum maritimum TaxID=1513271 RepID=A0A0J8H118_9ALTE|nr:ATP-binding protein [Catenovulum maritimum]KMT66713.1 hypothetical protein XM47_00875 [Catenovulum maritimum]
MSIQRYLLTVILSVVILATFSAALQGFKASNKRLNKVFDDEMLSIATTLKNSPIKPSNIQVDTRTSFAFQIWKNNKLILKSKNAPQQAIANAVTGFGYTSFLEDRWRFYSILEAEIQVIVAQPVSQRIESIEAVLLEAILPIVFVIPIIGIIVTLSINKSLFPIKELSENLKHKDGSDLTTIKLKNRSKELEPITETINGLLTRLAAAFDREQTMASNAAHELRTPISVLKLNAHNLKTAFKLNSVEQNHIDELEANTDRMAHVIEQVITLNRTSPENFIATKVDFKLTSLLQEVIANNYDQIEINQQSISLNTSNIMINADEFSLETMLDNLLKNAIKYSGVASQIQVSASKQNKEIILVIEDSGPGIDDSQLTNALQRFYRIKQHTETGSGLGLSIVGHIVELHGGKFELMRSSLGGLKVLITFPQMALEKSDAT